MVWGRRAEGGDGLFMALRVLVWRMGALGSLASVSGWDTCWGDLGSDRQGKDLREEMTLLFKIISGIPFIKDGFSS